MKQKTKTWALFLFILLIAGVFRVLFMQYVEFKGDEALNLFLASRPLFHHPFPPASQASSAGILNFPLLNYLLFPITLFTLYPPTISVVIAILNILTIGGFYLLFAKYHGKLAGFLAACILALSPWAILYSRKIWAQDFLLPLSLPFFLSLYKILHKEKKYWFLFGLSATLLIQLHQLAILLPVAIFIILRIKKIGISWRLFLGGIAIGLLPSIPYAWYMSHNFCFACQNTTTLATRFSFRDISTFIRPLQIISLGNFHTEFGNDFAVFAQKFSLLYTVSKLSYLAYVFVPLSLVIFWIKNVPYRIFVWAFIGIISVMFLLGVEPLMHYFIILLPFCAIFVASFLTQLIQAKYLRYIGIALVAIYFISLVALDSGFFLTLLQRNGLAGDYGAGYTESEKQVAQHLTRYRNNTNYKEIFIAAFTPIGLMKGYMPVGMMLFPRGTTQNHITILQKQYEKDPNNPLLSMEVFSYFTPVQHPSWEDVLRIRERALAKAVYQPIYQDILNRYLSDKYKNLYQTTDFILTYPQHWNKTIDKDEVRFFSNELKLSIISSFTAFTTQADEKPQPNILIANLPAAKATCLHNNTWCGTTYGPIKIGAQYYFFNAAPTGKINKQDAERIIEEILASITLL